MKNNFYFIFLTLILSSCCDCDERVPARVPVNYFSIKQLVRQGMNPAESPVAMQMLMADSTHFPESGMVAKSASFFNFKMQPCDCFYSAFFENKIKELSIERVENNGIAATDVTNHFVGSIGTSEYERYRTLPDLIKAINDYDIGLSRSGYGKLHFILIDTTANKAPNQRFRVNITMNDAKTYELISPVFYPQNP